MKLKKISNIIVASLLAISFAATAKPLTLINSTKELFTVGINNGCSSAFGVINVNSSKTVSEIELSQLCGQGSTDCVAKIFKSNNCTGKEIASFNFDTKTGLKDKFQSLPNYSITVFYQSNTVILTEALKGW